MRRPQSQDYNGHVVVLVPGEALTCGIGPYHAPGGADAKITYLSAKDVMRWTSLSEWLDKYELQHSTGKLAVSENENTCIWQLLQESRGGLPRPIIAVNALSNHISDLSGEPRVFRDR